jgi:hypothetical protein
MVIVKANQESEAGVLPSAELLEAMGRFNEELVQSGRMLAGEGLHPSSKGKRIRFAPGQKPAVIDGPFAETKELIAGFWLLQVRSMDEAVELIKRVPNPAGDDAVTSEIEIRPVFEEEDFGELVKQVPEVFEAERKFRQRADAEREERQRQSPR